jgi:hypothetical protein
VVVVSVDVVGNSRVTITVSAAKFPLASYTMSV